MAMPVPTETQLRDRPIVVAYRRVRVLVEKGPNAGLQRFISSQPLRIGSSADSDLVLFDRCVSRHHCALEPLPEGVRVRDEGARNGIFLDGMRIRDATVPGSFRLQIGDSVLLLEPQPEIEQHEQAVSTRFGDLLGVSARMRELFALLERAAKSDISLLLEGETGTGKELVAESVHYASTRVNGPFVVFDCGAVAKNLAEDALFGHMRGAFEGAHRDEPGVFEQADGGTLFLDELGELEPSLQVKLLRALESGTVCRLGGRQRIKIDVRTVAATNRNLEAEVARGNFREDLFYRFTMSVRVPPLRDRMEDIPILVEHLLSLENPPRQTRHLPDHIWTVLNAHHWPGNVRELRNFLHCIQVNPAHIPHSSTRAADKLSSAPATDSPPFIRSPLPVTVPSARTWQVFKRETHDAAEREYIRELITKAEGSTQRAAELAGVTVQWVRALLRKHGLRTTPE